MRHVLGAIAAGVLALAGCGDDGVAGAGDPEPARAEIVLVSGTAAGGDYASRVTLLPDDDAVAAYAGRFDGALAADVVEAARSVEVTGDQVLAAQVVAIGCDVPPGAGLTGSGQKAMLTADKVASPMKECFAPVTTVAIAAIPGQG